jgi:hypothetical protein
MRNLVMSVLVVGLLSLLPLSPRVAPSSGLLPVSISVGQDEANAYVTYRRARVTYRRAYRRGYRRAAYYGGAYYRPYTYGHGRPFLACKPRPLAFLFHPRAMADGYDPTRVRATYPQPA